LVSCGEFQFPFCDLFLVTGDGGVAVGDISLLPAAHPNRCFEADDVFLEAGDDFDDLLVVVGHAQTLFPVLIPRKLFSIYF